MFRSIVFAVTIVISVTVPAFAQDSLIIKPAERTIILEGRDFYIDSVVDNRITRNSLGEALVGLGNRPVPIYFSQPLGQTVKEFFDLNMAMSHGQIALIAVVNSLHVYEDTPALSARGVVRVDVSFCRWKSDTLRIVARTAKYLFDDKFDATHSHGTRVSEPWPNAFSPSGADLDENTPRRTGTSGRVQQDQEKNSR